MSSDDEDATIDASTEVGETPLTVDDLAPHPAPTAIEKANDLILRQMAKSIRIAHEINPKSWAVYKANAEVVLNIASYYVLTSTDRVRFAIVVVRDGVSEELREELMPYLDPATPKTFTGERYFIPVSRTEELLPKLRLAHEAAVRWAARTVRTNSDRMREHDPAVLSRIEQQIGEELPTPAYRIDALRADHIPLPYDIDILRQMAESIRVAHEINPNSWAVLERRGSISLIVSRYIALTTVYRQTSKATIIVATEAIDSELEREYSFNRELDAMKAIPCTFFEIPAERIFEALPRLRKAHLDAVEMAAREVRTRSARANEHRPDMLDIIENTFGEPLPRPAYTSDSLSAKSSLDSRRFWNVSAGPGNTEWGEFIHHACIALDWGNTPDVGPLPSEREAFTAALMRANDISVAGARSLWTFRNAMSIGDRVVSTARGELYGYGTIAGAYEFVEDDFPYRHRRPITWDSTEKSALDSIDAATFAKLRQQATIVELNQREFSEITGSKMTGMTSGNGELASLHPVEALHEGFAAAGLFYTPDQIATFYTALQTKGFVVLSGISGTGKSKIAQHFATMMPDSVSVVSSIAQRDDLVSLKVHPYSKRNGYLALPMKQIEKFPIPLPGESVSVDVRLGDVTAEAKLKHIAFGNGQNRIVRLTLSSEVKKRFQALDIDQVLYLEPKVAIEDGEDRITTFSILTPSEVERNSSLELMEPISNHLFLSVRPDWRDSRALIGYQNPLLGEYEWTDFLRFILRAGENYRSAAPIAWFVILDEMNLAHVEYYFADLLSVLESGRDNEGWTREAIRIQRPEPIDEQDEDVPPAEIRLPPNLYIIGTVNMDETTHAFSPKVLDRAFTMELSEVDFSSYPNVASVDTGEPLQAECAALLAAFSRNGRFARIEKAEIRDVVGEYPEIRAWLQTLNELLVRSRMNFGYRVFDEIAAFTGNGMRNFVDFELEQVFDRAVLMKVLPKFSGSAARLERPLLDLLAWCVDPRRLPQQEIRQAFDSLGDDGWSASTHPVLAEGMMFPVTSKRVMRMLDTLAVEGFASFG